MHETLRNTPPGNGDGAREGTAPPGPMLSVIMPIYNEIATLRAIIEWVRAVPIDKEIILVDDGSTDGSRKYLQELVGAGDDPGLRLFLHEHNQGKTAAVRTGVAAAQGRVVIIQDADLEYDPRDYPKLVDPIVQGRADVVYGSRFLGSPRRVLLFWHTVGNKFLTLLSNIFTNLNLTDMETCYKAFRADIIKRIPIRSSGFAFEPEVTAKVARLRCRVYEVPVAYNGRQYWEGKKITWRDGFHAIWAIIRFGLRPDIGEGDPGYQTLQRVERLRRYNRYLWDRISPYVGRRVLEIGAGTGSMTRYLATRELVVATDIREDYLKILSALFENQPNVEVRRLALGVPAGSLAEYRFDTVVCANVLEHIDDDVGALRQVREMLVKHGRVILVVPMLAGLYGTIDEALEHRRRYGRDELRAKMDSAGFAVEHISPFNLIGIPGWYLNSRLLKRRAVPGIQARINNLLTPWLRVEDKLRPPVGMSTLAVGRRF